MEELDFRYSDEIAVVAQAAFAEHAAQIRERLPYVEVRHVGGTSVYGLLTAGDVDLQVRVARDKSQHARTVLQEMYAPLYPDAWQETAYFYAPAAEPRVEIALTVMGNVDDLLLIESWDRIAAEPALADAYNALKRARRTKANLWRHTKPRSATSSTTPSSFRARHRQPASACRTDSSRCPS